MQTQTERVDKTLEEILTSDGEDFLPLISNLNDDERQLFGQLVTSLRSGEHGDLDILENFWKVDYTRRPPTMEEFIMDEYWLGSRTRPTDDNEGIFPGWREILLRDFDLDSQVHNTVVTGSLGIGKSWVCCVIILYRIALARLLRNPSHFFGMSRGSEIYYSILSITRAAVRETVFGDAMEFMGQSPYFREECSFNPDKKYTDNLIDLGNNITVNAGSKGWHVIGKNMMGILLDEGNFRLEKNPNLKAYSLYNNVRARIQNRFQKFRGFLPAISLLASSAADESSFTEKVKKEIQEVNQPKRQTIYQFAVYKIKSHTLRLSDRYFKVSYGLKSEDPRVLKGWYDKKGLPLEGEVPEVPSSGASTELVPEDYHDGFRRSTKQYLMDISGISVGGSHRLLPSTVDLEQCIDIATADGLKNPCKLKTISLSMDDKAEMYQYLDQNTFLIRRMSRVIPARHPESLRFAHVDLATQTMAGVSVGHLVGRQKVETYRAGEVFEEYRLVFEYDFILTITAGEASPISLGKIQNFFFWLRDHAGYRFGLITADQWQSEMPLQTLQAAGFNVDKLSMDRTKTPYYEWRSAIQEKRLRLFRQDQLVHEASELLDLADKVDHPPEDEGGSKDTADSAAGAYYNAISYTSKTGSSVAIDATTPALMPDTMVSDIEAPPVSIQLPTSIGVRPNSVFEA
jgi:hypothetical protein